MQEMRLADHLSVSLAQCGAGQLEDGAWMVVVVAMESLVLTSRKKRKPQCMHAVAALSIHNHPPGIHSLREQTCSIHSL